MNSYPIVIISGSRADAGLLTPVIEKALSTPALDPVILTLNRDWLSGIPRTRVCQIESNGTGDAPADISRSMGHYLSRFAFYLESIKPSLMVVLGDRWEVMAAVLAAHIARIPIAHIHGGEKTAGSYDQGFRDSITVMSTLHFTAHEQYKKEVIRLGAWPAYAYDVGALGADGLVPYHGERHGYIVAYYPETAEPNSEYQLNILGNIFQSIHDRDPKEQVYWFGPNHDVGSSILKKRGIVGWVVQCLDYQARNEFIALLARSRAIIGNSSAGIIEAPALGTPTINIGTRQDGRLMADTITQSDGSFKDLIRALNWADEHCDDYLDVSLRPYTGHNVAQTIIDHIVTYLQEKHNADLLG
jgi:UDP-hydrolysing UDP-N-acetyl-D-glucosamine 2-epimerase